jgi:hypothetical protein
VPTSWSSTATSTTTRRGSLAGDNPSSSIVIDSSVFARNGARDGLSHNLYINHVASFMIEQGPRTQNSNMLAYGEEAS